MTFDQEFKTLTRLQEMEQKQLTRTHYRELVRLYTKYGNKEMVAQYEKKIAATT